jgi:hypothetical protein
LWGGGKKLILYPYSAPDMEITPYLQVRSESVILYNDVSARWKNNGKRNLVRTVQDKLTSNLIEQSETGQTYTGRVTPGMRKRLTRAIEHLVQISRLEKVQLGFMTLKMPDDKVMYDAALISKKCLAPLMQWLNRQHGFKNGVWKAELQKRGQLHYHVIIDCYVDCKELNKKWNYLLKKHGFMDNHFAKFGHWQPTNSTNIRAVYKEKKICEYLVKEVTKVKQNKASVNGKVWDCSISLKGNKHFKAERVMTTRGGQFHYDALFKELVKKGLYEEVKHKHPETCTIYKMADLAYQELVGGEFLYPSRLLYPQDLQAYKQSLIAIKNKTRRKRVPVDMQHVVIDEPELKKRRKEPPGVQQKLILNCGFNDLFSSS